LASLQVRFRIKIGWAKRRLARHIQVNGTLNRITSKQHPVAPVKQTEMSLAMAWQIEHFEVPIRAQPDSLASPKSQIYWLGFSKISPHIPRNFLRIENTEGPVSVISRPEKYFRVVDGLSISVSATEQGMRRPTFHAGITSDMIRIRVGIDYKPQVARVYLQLGESWQDQTINVLGASRIQ
jgi:hypothetical protein